MLLYGFKAGYYSAPKAMLKKTDKGLFNFDYYCMLKRLFHFISYDATVSLYFSLQLY